MLIIGETRCDVYENSILSSQFFCTSKTSLKMKFINKKYKDTIIYAKDEKSSQSIILKDQKDFKSMIS